MIQETIAQVRAKLNIGEGETVDAGAVKSLLTQVEREASDLVDNLKSANSESKSRKEKIRELTTELETQKEKITELEGATNPNDELKTEVEGLRGFKQDWLKTQSGVFETQIGKLKDHPNFEKVQKRFVLPENDKKDGWDFSKLKDSELEANIKTLNDLNEIDYFATTQQPPTGGGKAHAGGEHIMPKNINEARAAFDS